jgi:hypothetical protein
MSTNSRDLMASGKGQSHSVYFDSDGRLIVEWYEHAEDAPYEHATMLIFSLAEQEALARALGLLRESQAGSALLAPIQARFDSYFAVQRFADHNKLAYREDVNFWP